MSDQKHHMTECRCEDCRWCLPAQPSHSGHCHRFPSNKMPARFMRLPGMPCGPEGALFEPKVTAGMHRSLAAAIGIPVSRLDGGSLAGVPATGDAEIADYARMEEG